MTSTVTVGSTAPTAPQVAAMASTFPSYTNAQALAAAKAGIPASGLTTKDVAAEKAVTINGVLNTGRQTATPRVYRGVGPGIAPEETYAPHPLRVLYKGQPLVRFADQDSGDGQKLVTAMSCTNGTVALTNDYFYAGQQPAGVNGVARFPTVGSSGSVIATCTTAGGMTVNFTTNIPIGRFDAAKSYVAKIFSGQSTRSGIAVALINGSSQQSWTNSGSAIKPDWNLTFLCSPTDTAQQGTSTSTGYGSVSGNAQVNAPINGGVAGKTITQIQFTCFGCQVGDVYVFEGIDEATRVRPAVLIHYDQSNEPAFLGNVVPNSASVGLYGGCRFFAGTDLSNNAAAPLGAIAVGWDITNGSLTRQNPMVNIPGDIYREYGVNGDEAARFSLPHSYWANPAGFSDLNTSSPVGKAALRALGIRYGFGTGQIAMYHGPQGTTNPFAFGVAPMTGLTSAQMLAYVDAAIACGTHINMFEHTITAPATNADNLAFWQGLRTRQDAGLIDVVNSYGMAQILDGLW